MKIIIIIILKLDPRVDSKKGLGHMLGQSIQVYKKIKKLKSRQPRFDNKKSTDFLLVFLSRVEQVEDQPRFFTELDRVNDSPSFF